MHQRRGVDQFNRHGRPHQRVTLRWRDAGGQKHQQGAQALAAGGDRLAGEAPQQRTVSAGQLAHPQLDPLHQPRDLSPAGLHHRLDYGLNRARAHRFTPTCSAMIPPAVRT